MRLAKALCTRLHSQRRAWEGARTGYWKGPAPLGDVGGYNVSHPLPSGRECQDQSSGSDDDCMGHGSGQPGEQTHVPNI